MIAVRRVGRPVRVRIMRRDESDAPAVFRNAVKLGDESHYVRHVFDDVARDDQIEFVVGKRVGNFAEVVNHVGGRARIVVEPDRAFDMGLGKGKPVQATVRGGVVGLIVDARGRRPFELPKDATKRIERLRAWNRALDVYPREI